MTVSSPASRAHPLVRSCAGRNQGIVGWRTVEKVADAIHPRLALDTAADRVAHSACAWKFGGSREALAMALVQLAVVAMVADRAGLPVSAPGGESGLRRQIYARRAGKNLTSQADFLSAAQSPALAKGPRQSPVLPTRGREWLPRTTSRCCRRQARATGTRWWSAHLLPAGS